MFYFGVVLLWFPELPESVEGCLPSSVWEHSLLSLLTLLHSVFSPLGPSAHALDILTVPQCVFACPHAFSPSLSWILSITIFQSRALSRVVLTALHYSRILNLTLCIFSSSRFTGFFSTDFSVPQGLQPSSPTCPDDSPGCVCVCVCVCVSMCGSAITTGHLDPMPGCLHQRGPYPGPPPCTKCLFQSGSLKTHRPQVSISWGSLSDFRVEP